MSFYGAVDLVLSLPGDPTRADPPAGMVAAAAHHHADHLTAVIALGAVLWLLGTAFVISWRDSGHRLRGLISEFDEHRDAVVDARQFTEK